MARNKKTVAPAQQAGDEQQRQNSQPQQQLNSQLQQQPVNPQLQQLPGHVPVQFQHFQHAQHSPHQQHQQHPHSQHHQQQHVQFPQHLQQHALAPQHHQHHQPLTMAPSMLMPAPVQVQAQAPTPIMPATPATQNMVPLQQAAPQQILPVAPAEAEATITISVEEFNRLRTTINTLLTALGRFGGETRRQLAAIGGDVAPDDGQSDALALAMSSLEGGDEKKGRKRRTHDPNAPKRPLTPYFLYLQYARSVIAADLGPSAPKGAVQAEGLRRWNTMVPDEKSGWNDAYQYNLRMYSARVHAFKNGVPDAKDMADDEALEYANRNGIPMPAMSGEANVDASVADNGMDDHNIPDVMRQSDVDGQHAVDHEHGYQLQGEHDADDQDDQADEQPQETKAPKKAAPRKRKGADTDADAKTASPLTKKPRRGTAAAKASDEAAEPKKSTRKKAVKA